MSDRSSGAVPGEPPDSEEPLPDKLRTGAIIDTRGLPPTAHLERLYAEVKGRLDTQRAEFDDLQRILAIVLAAAGVVLGFAASHLPDNHKSNLALGLLVASVVALGLAIVAGAIALWPRGVKIGSEPGPLIDDYVGAATNVMLFDLIESARKAYEDNVANGIRLWRSRLVRSQLVLLAVGAAFLAIGLLVARL